MSYAQHLPAAEETKWGELPVVNHLAQEIEQMQKDGFKYLPPPGLGLVNLATVTNKT